MTDRGNRIPFAGVCGVGTDIVELDRIRLALERYGDRFRHRIFSSEEIRYCESFSDPIPHFAARFAAKEAVSKAFGTGIGRILRWRDIVILNQPTGQPYILPTPVLQNLLHQHSARSILLSLSHSREYAIAVAILVG